ncbi:MAG: Asp23/Gls24 family envelope stress response protein [Desulfotomaculaceae bacterium]|nr:Asp23/Gls24 family envelope stress response protein [Desulfotomaculaceae bacterium]
MENTDSQLIVNKDTSGTIKISEEVVKIIAGLAATEIEGVAGMSGGIAGGIAEKLGRKNMTKGVKAEVGEKEAIIDLSIIVEYGANIQDIAHQIQNKVKTTVESMTGLIVTGVNINVQGVSFGLDAKEDEAKTK